MNDLRELQKFMAQISDRLGAFVDEMEAIGVKVTVGKLSLSIEVTTDDGDEQEGGK